MVWCLILVFESSLRFPFTLEPIAFYHLIAVLYSLFRKETRKSHLYLDFHYEWELNTVYQATPTHRLYIDLSEKSQEQNLCANKIRLTNAPF